MALSRRSTVLAALGLAVAVALSFAALRAWSGGSPQGYTVRPAGDAGRPSAPATADVGVSLIATRTADTLVFTVTARNQGPAELRSLLVHAALSPGAPTPSSTDCRTGAGIVNCGFVALPAGQEATATFTVPATGDPVTVTVTRISSTPTDPDASNDETTVTLG
jgi:Domain of unknown function DUF11